LFSQQRKVVPLDAQSHFETRKLTDISKSCDSYVWNVSLPEAGK